MSMSSWTVDGFGFELGVKGIDFVKNHEETIKNLKKGEIFIKIAEESVSDDDFIEVADIDGWWDYESNYNGGQGFGALVADVMVAETGINFEFCCGDGDTGSSDTIMLVNSAPWNFSEREKNLTAGEMQKICQPYMDELGIDGVAEYVSVEYYG